MTGFVVLYPVEVDQSPPPPRLDGATRILVDALRQLPGTATRAGYADKEDDPDDSPLWRAVYGLTHDVAVALAEAVEDLLDAEVDGPVRVGPFTVDLDDAGDIALSYDAALDLDAAQELVDALRGFDLTRSEVDDGVIERRDYYGRDPGERIGAGFKGAGRFRDPTAPLFRVLREWFAAGASDDADPLRDFDRPTLAKAVRVRGLRPRRGATEDELRAMLKTDARDTLTDDGDHADPPVAEPAGKALERKAKAAPVKPAAKKATPAAARRQHERVVHAAAAKAAAEVFTAVATPGASARAVQHRLDGLSRRHAGLLPPDMVDDLTVAGVTGDRDRVDATIDRYAAGYGLVRVSHRAGELDRFTPGRHQVMEGLDRPRPGTPVEVVQAGWALDDDGERTVVRPAVVRDPDPDADVDPFTPPPPSPLTSMTPDEVVAAAKDGRIPTADAATRLRVLALVKRGSAEEVGRGPDDTATPAVLRERQRRRADGDRLDRLAVEVETHEPPAASPAKKATPRKAAIADADVPRTPREEPPAKKSAQVAKATPAKATPSARTPRAGRTPRPSAGEVRDRLRATTSENEATEYLESLKLSVADLRALAAELSVRLGGRSKRGIIADIVKVQVSGRLIRDAIRRS